MEGVWVVTKFYPNREQYDEVIGVYTSNELAEQAVCDYMRKQGASEEECTIDDNDGMRYSECYMIDFKNISFMIEEFALNTKY